MKVADLPELVFDPASVDFLLELAKRRTRRVAFLESVEGGFGCEHSALDREMNAFEALGIEEAGRVAEDHPTIARNRRNSPPAAIRQRLRTIADHLSAGEQACDERVLLEILQHVLRIQARIGIVETSHE